MKPAPYSTFSKMYTFLWKMGIISHGDLYYYCFKADAKCTGVMGKFGDRVKKDMYGSDINRLVTNES